MAGCVAFEVISEVGSGKLFKRFPIQRVSAQAHGATCRPPAGPALPVGSCRGLGGGRPGGAGRGVIRRPVGGGGPGGAGGAWESHPRRTSERGACGTESPTRRKGQGKVTAPSRWALELDFPKCRGSLSLPTHTGLSFECRPHPAQVPVHSNP